MRPTCSTRLLLLVAAGLAGAIRLSAQFTYTWNNGTIPASLLTSGQSMLITTSAEHDFNAVAVTNQGTIEWAEGRLRSGNGGSISNQGIWNDTGTSTLGATSAGASAFKNDYGGAYGFTNTATGTYNKSGSGHTHFFDVGFTNDGAVNVTAGILYLNGGGTNTGTMVTASGASTVFTNSYTLATGSALTGAGTYQLAGGTLTASGIVTVSNLSLTGGTLGGTHTFTSSALDWNSGNWNGIAITTLGSGTTLAITSGNEHDFDGRDLFNQGTVNWSGGRLRSGNGGSIVNDGLWNDTGTSVLGGTVAGASAFKNDYGGAYGFSNSATGTYTKSGTGTTTFQDVGFNNAGIVNVNAGTLVLSGGGTNTGTIATASGATLSLVNSYTLDTGSTLTGTGTIQATGGTLTLNNSVTLSHLLLNGATLAGTHSWNGTVTWSTGNWNTAGTTTNPTGSILNISGPAEHDFDTRDLVNAGTINWSAGRLRSGNGGSILNQGQWNDTGTSGLSGNSPGASSFKNDYGGSYTFTNAAGATYTKSGSGNTIFTDVALTNDGTMNVTAGMLYLVAGGTNNGTITTGAGATLTFGNGFTLANGSSLLGAGTIETYGGAITLTGTVNLSHLQVYSATLAGTHSLAGTVTWNTGDFNTTGTTTNLAGSTFNIATAAEHDFNTRDFVNQGTVNWTAGRLRSGNDGSIVNQGQWNDTGTSSLGATSSGASAFKNDYGGTYTFTNAAGATYNKTGSGNTHFQDVPLLNDGAISVQSGNLFLNGGGTNVGTMVTASGANTVFSNSYTLATGSSLTGAGLYQATGGTLTVNGTVTVSHLTHTGGTLVGTHTFANSALTWNGSDWNSAGTTTLGTGTTLTVSGTAERDFNTRILVNQGTLSWTGGRFRSGNGGSITNEGLWHDLGTSTAPGTSAGASAFKNDYGGAYTFTNAASGTYHKAGTGLTTFQDVGVSNAGEIHTDAGTLSFVAGLSLAPTSVLSFSLGGTTAGTDYGLVAVSSALVLSGSLALDFSGGFQNSILGANTFTLLNSGATLTGSFANVANGQRLWTADGFGSFEVHYGAASIFSPSSLVLANFEAVPEPTTWLLLALGLIPLWRRRA
ncbi:beta strand repeat-containing protein [Oleiharenicola lentus]|uniref:beta strand repeat-containing protein n=1 Tax=Oleiharenicola lentus TaxID=2508720 RepID=UPI0013E99A60|nr:hypothetical protein [Oleiharenicola lentus]